MPTDRGGRSWRLGGMALAALGLVGPAQGREDRPWWLAAAQSVTAHHNLLRLADAEPVPAGLSRDDTLTRTRLDAQALLPFGRQRLRGQARWHDERHRRNAGYDHRSQALRVGLEWQTVGAWSGELALSRRQLPIPINAAGTGLLRDRGLERVDDAEARLQLGGTARASVVADLAWRQARPEGERPELLTRAQHEARLGLGLNWQPQGDARLGLDLRGVRGRHAGGTAGAGFQGLGIDLRATLPLSGAGGLDLALGYGRSRWTDAAARDFDGPTARLAWTWQLTGASRLSLRAARGHGQHRVSAAHADMAAFDGPVRALDDVRREDTLRLALAHRPGPRWGASVAADLGRRQLAAATDSAGVAHGAERSLQLRLGLDWTPRDGMRLDCALARERQQPQGPLGTALRAGRAGCTLGVAINP